MNKYIKYLMIGASVFCMTACNDFLDREPLDQITPAAYFYNESDLAAYTINLYNFTSIGNGSYGISVWANDNHTDNQVAGQASSRWVPGQWQVGSGGWDFTQIRKCNYFLDQVLPKFEEKKISGNETNIKHYIGEMYVLRAYAYFSNLQAYGDFPIVETCLPDEFDVLVEASVRQPRHKVARFILSDLDKAIDLLSESGPGGKNRVTKDVAYLLKSRVALFEGTWLKHHKGTAFVPGGQGWPGDSKLLEGFNIDTEIGFFLDEAMKSAKVVGDKVVGALAENTDTKEGMDAAGKVLNPYYMMFCDPNMDNYKEVLMWKAFDVGKSITHNIQMQLERNGAATGWSRGLVNSFVMRNGLPIYAANSGYDTEWEKQGVKATLQNRDSRIGIFTKKDGDVEYYTPNNPEEPEFIVNLDWTVLGTIQETRMVTGYAIKKGKYYDADMARNHHIGNTGSIVFRGTEAMLNYMEACVEKTGNVDATASNYWKALRRRAKVDEDFNKTISATVMSKEAEGDWGAYSQGKLIDATLYNVRRERRNELIGEGLRWMDLIRWRACDQINGYQMEGMRYWDSVYEQEWDGKVVVDEAGSTGNMSPKSKSVYIRPYQITKQNNSVYDGYKFTPAHYLSPLGQSTFRKTSSGDQTDYSTSPVYQNPGWPTVAGQGPTAVK